MRKSFLELIRALTAEHKGKIILCLIVVLALVIRLYFFVGLVNGDPQDDSIYYGTAHDIYKNHFDFARYRNIDSDYVANPAEAFAFRSMINYPIAIFFKIFGLGEFSASIWSLVLSIATIVLVFCIAKELFDPTIGLFSAFLLAIYPLDVVLSTRILPDAPLMFFATSSIFLLIKGIKGRDVLYFFAGISLGLGYLIKMTSLIMLPVLIFLMLSEYFEHDRKKSSIASKKIKKGLALLAIGFLVVFLAESAYFYSETGNPFLRYTIDKGTVKFKYTHEPVGNITFGPIHVLYNSGVPIYHLKRVFGFDAHIPNLFGLFFYTALLGGILCAIKKKYFLLFWLLLVLMYFEFGFLDLELDGNLKYYLMVKTSRYLSLASPAVVILSAYLLSTLRRRSQFVFLMACISLVLSASILISQNYDFYRGSLSDLRTTAEFVAMNDHKTFYADCLAKDIIDIFGKHKLSNTRCLAFETKEDELNGSFIILGGSRGVEVVTQHVLNNLPDFARNATAGVSIPKNWVLMKEIKGDTNAVREHDLNIYYVP